MEPVDLKEDHMQPNNGGARLVDNELDVQLMAGVAVRLDGMLYKGREVANKMNVTTDSNGGHNASSWAEVRVAMVHHNELQGTYSSHGTLAVSCCAFSCHN